VAHESLYLSSQGIYEARSSKIANENATCRAEFEKSYNDLRLVAACSKIVRTSVKVRKTKLLPLVLLRAQEENIRARFALSMHSSVHFAELTGELALLHGM